MSCKETFVPAKSYPVRNEEECSGNGEGSPLDHSPSSHHQTPPSCVFLTDGHVGGFYSKNLGSSSQGHLVPFYPNLANRRECIRRGEPLVVTSVLGKKATPGRETVIPEPDYKIPIVLLVYSNNLLPAAPAGLLGLLLLFQTTRVRFVFDDEALEVKIGEVLQESGDNVFVGGKNRWKYSTFVNWGLWWSNFPILVYFKEMQTNPEGQVHFFHVIVNGKQLYDVMVERAGPYKTSGPKPS